MIYAAWWLTGLGVVTACSWGRWLATGSIKVDESYPSEITGTLLFLALLAGWGFMIAGWRGFLAHPPAQPRRLAYLGLAVASLMLPMISNDVFSLMSYGALAARGRDVYTSAAALHGSPFFAFVGERWDEKVCVYGPTTLVALFPVSLAGHSLWLALLAIRATFLLPIVVAMELSLRFLRDRPALHAMLWLNPLWVLEGPGQLHADVLGVAAIVVGIVLAARRQGRASLLYAVALLGKVSFALAGPYFWLVGAPEARQRVRRALLLAAAVVATGVVFYAPFWRGPATVTEPLHALASMNPGGSITEVVATSLDVLRGGAIPRADAPVRAAVDLARTHDAATWFVVSIVLRLVTLGIAGRVLWGLLRRPRRDEQIAFATGILIVAFVTIASHRFQSWYLLAALPFFGLRSTAAWNKWWVAVAAVSATTEFVYVMPRTALLLAPWVAVTTGATALLFVLWPRARFLRID